MRLLFVVCVLLSISIRANAQSALGPGFYDDRFFLLDYTGCSQFADATMYASTRTVCIPGNNLSFSLWGDGFVWYTQLRADGGTNSICINSVCTDVSAYAPTTTPSSVEFSGLGYGTHDVFMSCSVSCRVTIDAIHVLPPAPQPTLEPQEIVVSITLEPPPTQPADETISTWTVDAPSGTQTVGFEYRLSAGDMLIALIAIIIAVVLLAFLGIRLVAND